MTFAYILLGLFILFAYTAEAMSGFGSIVIALSLGALFFPIDFLLPLLVPLNICMTGYMAWRHRAHIDRTLLGQLVLPFMLAGLIVGTLLQPHLGGEVTKLLFALLITWFAARELLRMRGTLRPPAHPTWLSRGIITGAGVTHGLFASGGPLLVYGLAGTDVDKSRLRATLIVVWFTLNSLLTTLFLVQGRLQPVLLPLLAYLPLIPLGIWAGEKLHHRVDENGFRRVVYWLLVGAGGCLVVSGVLRLV